MIFIKMDTIYFIDVQELVLLEYMATEFRSLLSGGDIEKVGSPVWVSYIVPSSYLLSDSHSNSSSAVHACQFLKSFQSDLPPNGVSHRYPLFSSRQYYIPSNYFL